MTHKEFYNMTYTDQWFHLVEWATDKYKRHPYLYYVLHTLTETYKYSLPFNDTIIKTIHYTFSKR